MMDRQSFEAEAHVIVVLEGWTSDDIFDIEVAWRNYLLDTDFWDNWAAEWSAPFTMFMSEGPWWVPSPVDAT